MTHYIRNGDDIDRGLVGHWKLDDAKNGSAVAIDYANFKDGVITDGVNADGVNGLNPDALDFNGTTTKVVSSSDVNSAEGSCSVWFKKDDAAATANTLIVFDSFYFAIDFASSKARCIFYDTGTWRTASSTQTVIQSVWHHVVFTWKENDKIQIFLDGIAGGTYPITTYTRGALVGTTIGNVSTTFFLGQIQNVRTYDRVLTTGEISKLHRLRL